MFVVLVAVSCCSCFCVSSGLGLAMESDFINNLVSSSVELAVLAGVLFGMYKLTLRVIDVISVNMSRCCDCLEQRADALDSIKRK